MNVKEIIRKRKSVRTYNGEPFRKEDEKDLMEYVSALHNPFGIDVAFKLLPCKEYGLASPVIVGEDTYLGGKVPDIPNHEIAFGYTFEEACLYALDRGIGTVFIAGTLDRPSFEKAMDLGNDEVMPAVSPLGYPAKKRSLRENLMRKAVHADERKPFRELFFEKRYGKPLTEDHPLREYLELVRIAPSATNTQPWRVIVEGKDIHFYEARTMKDTVIGDIQKVDIGIALCHFDLTWKEDGHTGIFVFEDPKIDVPEKTEYVVTYRTD